MASTPRDPILSLVQRAARSLAQIRGLKDLPEAKDWSSLGEQIANAQINIGELMAESAIIAETESTSTPQTLARDGLRYLVRDRPARETVYSARSRKTLRLRASDVASSVTSANRTIARIHALSRLNGIPIFQLLGMRNLSSLVGEVFSGELAPLLREEVLPNPNQDGYPDLLAMTPSGRQYYDRAARRGHLTQKSLWSPFPFGGIEVKATCGNTPSAKVKAKPAIGEARTPSLQSLEWKSHHRNTNNLLGLYWDFVDGIPTILGAFYRNDLTTEDWGTVVKPKEGGGNTTSVSIMNRTGVKMMGKGWILLPDDDDLLNVLAARRLLDLPGVLRPRRR